VVPVVFTLSVGGLVFLAVVGGGFTFLVVEAPAFLS